MKVFSAPLRAMLLCVLCVFSGATQAGLMALPGAVSVSESGSASYTLPLTLPPGSAGVKPNLMLAYDSQAGAGMMGAGWSLSGVSVITLCPQTIDQDGVQGGIHHDSNDRYCLNGQRLVADIGQYGADGTSYRTEIDGFSRIVSYGTELDGGPSYFKVWTKSGDVMEFGTLGGDSRAYVQGKDRVRIWGVSKVTDVKGNEVKYSYYQHVGNAEFYIQSIQYTDNLPAGASQNAEVTFTYADRPDVETIYVGGGMIRMAKRLEKIETKVGNVLVRRYQFTYDQSPSSLDSRLTSITECATSNGTQMQCLPPVTFNFAYPTSFNFPSAGLWNGTADVGTSGGSSFWGNLGPRLRTVDFNGDGKTDLIQAPGALAAPLWRVCLSTGAGFNCEDWLATFAADSATVYGDINGDGRTDITKRASGSTWNICHSTGIGFNCTTGAGPSDSDVVMGDYNGDGRVDLGDDNGTFWTICLSTGSAFSCSVWNGAVPDDALSGDFDGDGRTDLIKRTSGRNWTVCLSQSGSFNCQVRAGTAEGGPVGDFNGDGLTDLADFTSSSNWEICLSTGAGFSCSIEAATTEEKAQFGDFNGDGKLDIAKLTSGSSWKVCLYRGPSFNCSQWNGTSGSGTILPADLNGDGISDLLHFSSGTQWQAGLSQAKSTNPVTEIYNGIGDVSLITYRNLQDASVYTKGSGSTYPTVEMQGAVDVVSQVTGSNGIGGQLTTSYRYGGLRANYTGRGALGFQWMESSQVETGLTTRTEYRQDWPYIGMPSLTRKKIVGGGNNGTLYQASYSYACISMHGVACSVAPGSQYFPYLASKVESSWDLNGAVMPTVTTTFAYDSYGNVTQTSTNSGDGYSKTINNTYVNQTGANTWKLGRLIRATNTSYSPIDPTGQTRTTAFAYDAAGLLSREVVEPDNSSLCLVTTYGYDAFGNKTSSTVRNCNGSALYTGFEAPAPSSPAAFASRTSTVTYDSRGQFPIGSTNAKGHEETRTFDPKTGAILSLTGPNNLTTQWQYDAFGRKTLETRADGTKSTWLYLYCQSVEGGTTPCPSQARYAIYSRSTNSNGFNSAPPTYLYYDLADRVVRSETRGFDGGAILQDTEYDSLGRVWRSSKPYYSTTQTPQWTYFSYDAVGRVLTVTTPDNAVASNFYNGLSSSSTNAKQQTETRTVNSQGQLISVRDADGKLLTYQYDVWGNLVQTTDPAGNVVIMGFDLRGRKTVMIDPDMGTWYYTYNALGELTRQIDAKSQTTTMEYDILGRMTRRTEGDLISNWYYDKYPSGLLQVACGKSVGKLCRAESDTGYKRTNRYDNQGRLDRVQTAMGLTTYTMEQSYDDHGRLSVVDYPTLFGVRYSYNSYGYMKDVRNKTSDALYWEANELDAQGRIKLQKHGNNVITTQIFDEATGRLESILAGNGNVVQNLAYQYDSIGNVSSRNDANQLLNETFGYDNLNRLTSSTVNSSGAGIVTTNYTYDLIGNIQTRGDLGSYHYGHNGIKPHAVKSILLNAGGSRDYIYDGNGNLTQEIQRDASIQVIPALGRTQTYTSFNMPETIANGAGATLNFVYGPEHQRIKQEDGNVTTVYIHPDNAGGLQYEKETSPSKTEQRFFVSALGQTVAVVKKNGLGSVTATQYWHRDALGSVTAITNETGGIVERFAYEPFGKRRFPNGSKDPGNTLAGVQSDRGYTGHEHLDSVGLIHMNGRIYDPTIGRFMSADPIIQDGQGLQSYNRYSYTINNPMIYTDPSGFSWWGEQVDRFSDEVHRWERDFRHEIRRPNSLLGPILRVTGTILSTAFCGPWAPACIAGVEAIVGRAQGVTGSELVGNVIRAGVTAAAMQGIGEAANLGTFGKYAAISGVGCFQSMSSGGNCGQGAAASFLGAWATVNLGDNILISAVAGGAGSVITGGKFASGAVTGAYAWLAGRAGSSIYDKSGPSGNSPGIGQKELDQIVEKVYEDYPALKGYGMEFEVTDYLFDKDGSRVAGEWGSQGKITIATAGFSATEIQGTVLHELLHVDAANHLRFGNRYAYRFTVWKHNHGEIYEFQSHYTSHLSGGSYSLTRNGPLNYGKPNLNRLSWRE